RRYGCRAARARSCTLLRDVGEVVRRPRARCFEAEGITELVGDPGELVEQVRVAGLDEKRRVQHHVLAATGELARLRAVGDTFDGKGEQALERRLGRFETERVGIVLPLLRRAPCLEVGPTALRRDRARLDEPGAVDPELDAHFEPTSYARERRQQRLAPRLEQSAHVVLASADRPKA